MSPFCRFIIFILVSAYSFVLKTSSTEISYEINKPNGAITVLIKGGDNLRSYDSLLERNRRIKKYLWIQNKYDMIIFHTNDLPLSHQIYIQSFIPDIQIKYIDITSVFDKYQSINNPVCPNTIESLNYSPGYHSMCYFWFASFIDYVKDYEWILRIDDDCHIISNVRKIFPPPTSTYLSSTRWIELDKVNFDTISSSKEGVVVKGLKQFARIFASQNDIFFPDETWQAPYTNLMFIRISWLKSQTLILKFIDEVAASKCIYSNRWGDLPLWGTALRLTDVPSQYLHIPYEHGSHHMTVLQDGRIMVHKSWYIWLEWGFNVL